MGHDGQMPAAFHDPLKKAHQIVRVPVGEKTVGPVGQGFGADADRGRPALRHRQERIDVAFQYLGPHHQGIAAGKQHVGHLGMGIQIARRSRGVGAGEAMLIGSAKLGPTETVGAKGMAGLPLARKDEHRLGIFVLHAVQGATVELWHVEGGLLGRMGIHPFPDTGDGLPPAFGGRVFSPQGAQRHSLPRRQHAGLGEGQLKNRIVGNGVPVDQLVHHVVVGTKRKYPGNQIEVLTMSGRQGHELGDAIQVVPVVGGVAGRIDGLHGYTSFLRSAAYAGRGGAMKRRTATDRCFNRGVRRQVKDRRGANENRWTGGARSKTGCAAGLRARSSRRINAGNYI